MHWLNSHQGLESLVASSAKFRTLVGAANADAAKGFVFYGGTEDSSVMPWALITCRGCKVLEEVSYSAQGELVLSFDVPASAYAAQSTNKAKLTAFLTDIDTILTEMRTNSRNRSVNWNMKSVEGVVSPRLMAPRDSAPETPFYTASFRIGWA